MKFSATQCERTAKLLNINLTYREPQATSSDIRQQGKSLTRDWQAGFTDPFFLVFNPHTLKVSD